MQEEQIGTLLDAAEDDNDEDAITKLFDISYELF